MTEQIPTSGDKQGFSRRTLLKAVAGAALTAAAGNRLTDGIRLNAPLISPYTVTVGRMAEDEFLPEDSFELDDKSILTITPEGELLFEPSEKFFIVGRELEYAHRGGNSVEAIHEAFAKGTELFDIDAILVGDTVRGEHGIVPQSKLHIGQRTIELSFPIVIDVNEKEIKFGMPSKYEELVACIASLSTTERELAVSTELKRGEFDQETLKTMFRVHQKYNVPLILHSDDPQQLMAIGNEVASSYYTTS